MSRRLANHRCNSELGSYCGERVIMDALRWFRLCANGTRGPVTFIPNRRPLTLFSEGRAPWWC